jgi:hypothetical protein
MFFQTNNKEQQTNEEKSKEQEVLLDEVGYSYFDDEKKETTDKDIDLDEFNTLNLDDDFENLQTHSLDDDKIEIKDNQLEQLDDINLVNDDFDILDEEQIPTNNSIIEEQSMLLDSLEVKIPQSEIKESKEIEILDEVNIDDTIIDDINLSSPETLSQDVSGSLESTNENKVTFDQNTLVDVKLTLEDLLKTIKDSGANSLTISISFKD